MGKILHGDAKSMLKTLEPESIHCSVTSPPYFQQRNYQVEGQLGMEAHFEEYINNLCDIYDEVWRVLRKDGCIFVNLGDTYGTKSGNMGKNASDQPKNPRITGSIQFEQTDFKMHKCLLMIPERFAIEMTRRGWILRNQIIWHKPNQMPQSAKDRFTVDFEKIFFFVKSKKYYFEQQLEPYTKPLDRWGGYVLIADGESEWDRGTGQVTYRKRNIRPNAEGRNKRTVWSINTKAFKDAHFATYPVDLVEPCIKAGCPIGGTVLDPFFGSGTTGVVAESLGRDYLGIELNPAYIEIAEARIAKAKALLPQNASPSITEQIND